MRAKEGEPYKDPRCVHLELPILQNNLLTTFEKKTIEFLSSFSVRVRYRGEEPTLEEAHQTLETAKMRHKYA